MGQHYCALAAASSPSVTVVVAGAVGEIIGDTSGRLGALSWGEGVGAGLMGTVVEATGGEVGSAGGDALAVMLRDRAPAIPDGWTDG